MPYCPIDPTANCRIYYETSTSDAPLPALGTASPNDVPKWTGKPKLLIFVPLTFDVSHRSVRQYALDERLLERFDMIVYEPRGHGRTECKPSPSQDAWTLAGDIICFLNHLQIPAVHILTGHCVQSDSVLRLAVLAPELILSLTLCSVAEQVDSDFFNHAIGEIVDALSKAPDLETWYESVVGKWYFNFTEWPDSVLQDEYGGIFVRRYNPSRAGFGKVFAAMGFWVARPPVPEDLLAQISCPVNVIQGAQDVPYPHAGQALAKLLKGANPLVEFEVDDAPLCVFATHPDPVIDRLLRLPTSSPAPPAFSAPFPVRTALERLAHAASLTRGSDAPQLVGAIRERPELPSSFSIASPEAVAAVAAAITAMAKEAPPFTVPGCDDPEPWTGKSWDECHKHRWQDRYA